MGSPRCTLNRWGNTGGNGSTPKTEEAKEMEDKLKKMMAEREKIDKIWFTNNNEKQNIIQNK